MTVVFETADVFNSEKFGRPMIFTAAFDGKPVSQFKQPDSESEYNEQIDLPLVHPQNGEVTTNRLICRWCIRKTVRSQRTD
jgi:hypothetical protein